MMWIENMLSGVGGWRQLNKNKKKKPTFAKAKLHWGLGWGMTNDALRYK